MTLEQLRLFVAERDAALSPDLDIVAVMKRFDASGADELAVLDEVRRVVGIISEAYVRRRYGEGWRRTSASCSANGSGGILRVA